MVFGFSKRAFSCTNNYGNFLKILCTFKLCFLSSHFLSSIFYNLDTTSPKLTETLLFEFMNFLSLCGNTLDYKNRVHLGSNTLLLSQFFFPKLFFLGVGALGVWYAWVCVYIYLSLLWGCF